MKTVSKLRHSLANRDFLFRTLLLACLLAISPGWAQAPQPNIERTWSHPALRTAQQFIESDHGRIVDEIIRLTEVPAPPFRENSRAQAFAQMLRDSGVSNVEIDAEGNVLGLRKGAGTGPLVAIAAHLDTVFPEGTDVKVRRDGTRLSAPGIGDNSRSLAVVLAIVRALDSAKVETASDILFVGNVGEEGPGDLRGVRYLFQKGAYKDRIKLFVSLDGAGSSGDVVTGALGSKRYRVTFRGPGGHSYGAFGLVNPAYALAKAMDKLSKILTPAMPRTTFNVGVIGGGTSVNSIPNEVWMDVDLRSESPDLLNRLNDDFLRQMRMAADEENRVRSTTQGRIEMEAKIIGERPSGSTPVQSAIVVTASEVIRRFGLQVSYSTSSTDANVPISMGIPAITIDSGGHGGRAHALDEWIDVEQTSSVRGIQIVLTTVLSLAGIH